MTPMYFDLGILAILAFTAFRGASTGLVWQLAWIAALILCFMASDSASPAIAKLIPVEAPLNRWIAMFAVYLISVFVTFWIARKISNWMEKHRFKEFDRHLGALFGFAKGVLIALTLTFFLVTLSTSAQEIVVKSKSGYAAALVMDRLHPIMSDEFHEAVEQYIHQLDGAAEKKDLKHAHDDDGKQGSAPKADGKSGHVFGDAGNGKTDSPKGAPAEIPLRQRLLREIAALRSVSPADQSTIIADIKSSLSGLPNGVATGVLSDWHSDLVKSDNDPDPETDATTDLDTRIRRWLKVAGIP